jgi:hypothetical protein
MEARPLSRPKEAWARVETSKWADINEPAATEEKPAVARKAR